LYVRSKSNDIVTQLEIALSGMLL